LWTGAATQCFVSLSSLKSLPRVQLFRATFRSLLRERRSNPTAFPFPHFLLFCPSPLRSLRVFWVFTLRLTLSFFPFRYLITKLEKFLLGYPLRDSRERMPFISYSPSILLFVDFSSTFFNLDREPFSSRSLSVFFSRPS